MSGLLDLPLELILDAVACLSQREVIALSKCNKATREAMQPFVMPGLAIKVDCSVRYQRDQTDKVALEAPIIHNGNIKAVCSAARDGLLDYYLGSVTELVIHERDAVRHRFMEPEDLADYSPTGRRTGTTIKAFDYFSPQYLATRLTALKKVFVHGDIRCLSSPLPKLNVGVFWQCLVSHCPDVECKVYVAPCDVRKYKSIAMKNLAVFKHVAGLCPDVTFMLPACFDHVDKIQPVESFEVGDSFEFGLEIIRFDPQVLQRFDNLRSIHINDPDLPINLEQIVPNLEKLIVALDSCRYARVDDAAPLTLHSTLKELACERKDTGPYHSWTNLLLFRFPNLSSFNLYGSKTFRHHLWKRGIEPLLLKTLCQSTKLETLKIDELVTAMPANKKEALLKNYAFSESLRELTLHNGCATWLCSSSNDSPILPELRVIELRRDFHTKHFLDGWDLDSFKILLQGFPKLELVLYPKDRQSLGKSLDDDPKMQENLKASAKVLSEPQGPTGSNTKCHQLLIQWAVWRYGRTSLVHCEILDA